MDTTRPGSRRRRTGALPQRGAILPVNEGPSMSEVSRILDQFRRTWDGDAWHGTPLWKILAGTSAAVAAARPVAGGHSIAEIVLHIAAWHEAVCQRLRGQEYEPPPSENWPDVIGLTEPAWENTLFELRRTFEELCVVAEELSDHQLDRPVPGKNHSLYVLLHRVIQHHLYHSAQIALLNKRIALPVPRLETDRPAFGAHEALACTRLLDMALEEDLGVGGDLTSLATIPADRTGRAVLSARS